MTTNAISSLRAKFHLLRTLSHHRHLAGQRMIPHKNSVLAQLGLWLLYAFGILYLAYIGVLTAFLVGEQHSFTGWHVMYMIAPIILFIDFLLRFAIQQTPSQLILPYLLLPIPKYTCIDAFLVRNLFCSYNLLWFAAFIPYAFLAIFIPQSLVASIGALLGFYLLALINAEWYLVCRTLISRSFLYWLLPVAVYGLFALPICLDSSQGLNLYAHCILNLAKGLTFGNPLYYLATILLIGILFVINRRLQYHSIRVELTKKGRVQKASRFSLRLFDHWGVLGSYVKLEMLCMLRNRNPRKALISYLIIVPVCVFMLCVQGSSMEFMDEFWLTYIFFLYAAFVLVRIMTFEGNYIDLLMNHTRSIHLMLCAKYLVSCVMLLIPLLCTIPNIYLYHRSWLQVLAMYAFIAGPIHFMYFQLAVYNNQTCSLNEKVTGKTFQTNNALQMLFAFMGFMLPLLVVRVGKVLIGTEVTSGVMLVVGLAFMLSSRLWIGNIYQRMMRRRYKNLDNFKATRS